MCEKWAMGRTYEVMGPNHSAVKILNNLDKNEINSYKYTNCPDWL